MTIKTANEKQKRMLESLLRKSKYELKLRIDDLNSVECSVLIDFFMNECKVREINLDGTKIDEFFLRKNKILIEDALIYNENKVVGAASEKAISFLKKLIKDNRYELKVADSELTAKIVYELTNHLLNKEKHEDTVAAYLTDKMNSDNKEDISNSDDVFISDDDFSSIIDNSFNTPE